MLSSVQLARRRGGLGYDEIWDILGEPPPPFLGTPPITSPSSGKPWWESILAAGVSITNSIARGWGDNPYGGLTATTPTYTPVVDQYGRVVAQSPGSAVSQGVGAGLQASVNSLSSFFGVSPTTLLIGGGVGLFLLFRQPPRRR